MSLESIATERLVDAVKDLKYTLIASSLFLAYYLAATNSLTTPDMEAIKQKWEEMLST